MSRIVVVEKCRLDAFEAAARVIAEPVIEELTRAMCAFPSFHSAHEGYAVLLEEVDELWDEVKKKQGTRDRAKLRKEAIQVAAMALRFALECDGSK
jgi:NTP pyrophosphatase (non-canonical NTP hydrolase)